MSSSIYTITNNLNGMKYVGQSVNVDERWYHHIYDSNNGSNTYIHRSMKKHGVENFTLEVVEEDVPLTDINDKEEYWIRHLNTLRPNGYNLTLGGEGMKGFVMPQETKDKLSALAKERYENLTEEEKIEYNKRLPKGTYDLDKMNEGFQRWLRETPKHILDDVRKRAVETKKEKGYDFYNFSFGRMSEEEKEEMYKKVSMSNPRRQDVEMLDENGVVLKEFHSLRAAARYLHDKYNYSINGHSNIRRALSTTGYAYGFKWRRK